VKKVFWILLVVIIGVTGLTVFRDLILRSVVAGAASKIVGAPVHIEALSFSLMKSTIHMKGFRIDNPSGFPNGILVSISTIQVKYDRPSLFKKKLHLLKAEIDLKEVGLIKNKEGVLNVDSLAIVKKQQIDSKSSASMALQIDLLTLSIGKIVNKDYTQGPEPRVNVHDLNIHKSYKNITSIEQLVILILAEPVKAAGIQGAKIYGTMLLTGVAILPVAAVFTFTAKDNAQQVVDGSFEHVYAVSEQVIGRMGSITAHDAAKGKVRATIHGASVSLHLEKRPDGKTEITVSARKFMFPQPAVAGGVLYQIAEKL